VRDSARKRLDELLVVHPQPSAERVGREPVAPAAEALPADVDALAARLRATAEPGERGRLFAAIQTRFGNSFAAQVMQSFLGGAPPPPPADPSSGANPG
jgi:hypothetical protein